MVQEHTHTTYPESREPLLQLIDVPVDILYLKKLFCEIEAHGGQGARTSQYEAFSMLLGKKTFCLCTFAFTPGTYREYGLTVVYATPFTIFFPDGGTLAGTLLMRPNAPLGAAPTTILQLYK
jgi:hypothetical protein